NSIKNNISMTFDPFDLLFVLSSFDRMSSQFRQQEKKLFDHMPIHKFHTGIRFEWFSLFSIDVVPQLTTTRLTDIRHPKTRFSVSIRKSCQDRLCDSPSKLFENLWVRVFGY